MFYARKIDPPARHMSVQAPPPGQGSVFIVKNHVIPVQRRTVHCIIKYAVEVELLVQVSGLFVSRTLRNLDCSYLARTWTFVHCVTCTPPALVKGSRAPSVRSHGTCTMFLGYSCTLHCRHANPRSWSGVFNLLKFDLTLKKKKKKKKKLWTVSLRFGLLADTVYFKCFYYFIYFTYILIDHSPCSIRIVQGTNSPRYEVHRPRGINPFATTFGWSWQMVHYSVSNE